MLNPRPLSPFFNSITTGSALHIAKFVKGSNERDLFLLSEFGIAEFSAEVNVISDLAFTSLSDMGATSLTPE